MSPRKLLLDSFNVAVAAADPLHIVSRHLPKPPKGHTLVVGAGKAAAAMALAVESHWPKEAGLDGIVITRYDHGLSTNRIAVYEAGHPEPDKQGEQVAREILVKVKQLGTEDLLLCLVSGGGSSLLSLPVAGISMNNLKNVTRKLLRCGATIHEINTVRKHLSAIQGGRLAASCRAPILALIISDVTGDEPTNIASGPCAPDPTTYQDALAILERYRISKPISIMKILISGAKSKLNETPKPGDIIFQNVENRVIATSHNSLVAAGDFFRSKGIPTAILGDTVTGEARHVAKVYAALVHEIRQYGHPWRPPVVLISGGETTVTVNGKGNGGRNTEFLLSLAIELAGTRKVYALACDTDGVDGLENNAGAIVEPDSLYRAEQLGINPVTLLANNDTHTFFKQIGDLVITNPTRTNVSDYRAIMVL
ncbi:MAG: glycerate kinase [Betaproteobacteria bacterium]|nr:MAG: glycerate kinase [Betaproteobacteria bacterium]